MGISLIQILIIVLFPSLWIKVAKVWRIEKYLSPVVLSYLTGILLANFKIMPLDPEISKVFGEYTVVLAIPLLLYSTDLMAWIKHARQSVLSFVLCIISGIIASIVIAFVFKNSVEDSGLIAGMLVGVYTGGTPNMNAIGIAMSAKSETLVLMNAADIICGGVYLIFLTSVAHPLLSKVLPAFLGNKQTSVSHNEIKVRPSLVDIGLITVVTIVVIAVTLGVCLLIFGDLNQLAFILLMLTSLSILASFSKKIRTTSGSFEFGEYLLLMFCVAIGMQADFSTLVGEGGAIITFTACVLSSTVFLHLIFSRIFKIDVDTFMITSTAALYGPVFIGQIASTIKNRSLIVSGMATGLIGYAIGNYLGISVVHVLRNLLM